MAVTQADPSALEEGPSYRLLVLVTVSLATMLYSLTITIVNVALPQLQGALSVTQEQISWVVTLNVVATAVATPLTGSAVAFFGRRPVFLWSILGFTLSTIACAMISSLEGLLFFRILQGVFGAPLVPLGQATLLQTYPKEEHAKANGFLGMSVVIGPAIAPTLGGYLSEAYGWRWVFLMIVPLGVVAGLGVMRYIRDSGKDDTARFDYLGFALFSITIISLQLVLDQGERSDWFDSPFILSTTAIMATAFYMFVVNTMFVAKPFISPTLFTNRNYVVGLVLVFVYGSLNFTPLVLLPNLLQNLKGYPDTLIGMILAMRGGGMVIGFFLAARMGRFDPRIGLLVGMVMIGISGWSMSLYDLNVSFWTLSWPSILQGIGCGLMWVPLSVVTFFTLPPRMLPEGAALFHLLRNMGTSLYVALTVFLLIRTSRVRYSEMVEQLTPYSERLEFPAVIGGGSVDWTASLGRLAGEVTRQSLMIGYNNSFYLYALVCFATLPALALVTTRKPT